MSSAGRWTMYAPAKAPAADWKYLPSGSPTREHAVLSKELTRGRMPRHDAVSLRAAGADGWHSKLLLKRVVVRTLVVKDAPSSSQGFPRISATLRAHEYQCAVQWSG